MATDKEFFNYITERLGSIEQVTFRPMMGEYIVYYRGKVVGGVYDNRFLVKATKAAHKLLPDSQLQLPYDGAKPMITVDADCDKDFLEKLFEAIYSQLPASDKR